MQVDALTPGWYGFLFMAVKLFRHGVGIISQKAFQLSPVSGAFRHSA